LLEYSDTQKKCVAKDYGAMSPCGEVHIGRARQRRMKTRLLPWMNWNPCRTATGINTKLRRDDVTAEESFIAFLSQCRDKPPLSIEGGVEFSISDWTEYANAHSPRLISDSMARAMLLPYEHCGWIMYTELMCWRILATAPPPAR